MKDKWQYSIKDDAVTITGYDGDSSVVTIPSILEGYPVKVLGDRAFDNCENLTSITIPESVTKIGDGVFSYCPNLSSVTFSGNTTDLGQSVFKGTPFSITASLLSIMKSS